MIIKPIIIVAGEPYSIFLEIFLKSLKKNNVRKLRNPIILICSKNLLLSQMQKLKYKFGVTDLNIKNLNYKKLNNKKINLINVNFDFKKPFDKISFKSKIYIENCINLALALIKKNNIKMLINGPISKTHFLQKKLPGMTEYFAKKTQSQGNEVMLIFNKKLAVSPLTTHLPLKKIFKKITISRIIKHVDIINNFYEKCLRKKIRIGITGLNPHCETTDRFSEDEKILKPAVRNLKKKGVKIEGPYAADTIFLKNNIKRFDVIIGMYHDQVLTPIKTLYGFNAINITLGLPFLRVTPDHGPNNQMIGKNLSSPVSLIEAILFTKKISEN